MRATVRFGLPDGREAVAGHGDILGRVWSASVQLNDGRVSEAHALVSLRGRELRLLSLRGRFAVNGKTVGQVPLETGQTIFLAPGLAIEVLEVQLPESVLALEGEGIPRVVLSGVATVLAGPPVSVQSRYLPEGQAHIWSTGKGWILRQPQRRAREVGPGDTFEVSDRQLRLVDVPLEHAGGTPTWVGGGVDSPMRIVSHFDSIELHRPGTPVATLSGIAARILAELIAIGGPTSWEAVAREVWSDDMERSDLRRRWDVALMRLRRKLSDLAVRDDLIRSDGTGNLQLVLREHDSVEDLA